MLKDQNFRARLHLSDFLTDYSLEQLVTAPTYTSGSLLDVCIVKNRELVNDCRVNYCHFSPHKFIQVDVDIPKQRKKPTVISSRSINRVDIEVLNRELLSCDWGAVFNAETVNDQWGAFLDQLLPVFNDHASLKK